MGPASARAVLACLCAIAACRASEKANTIIVELTPAEGVASFRPLAALGTTVDRVPENATDVFFRPDQLAQIMTAGWGAVSYRINTELFVQAWHWNGKGRWSDARGQGYFVGDANPTEMIRHSYGYSLPHRGFTRNSGTEFDGYSRLDDGDINSYWKSNPYLTQHFSGDEDAQHPQWVVIDLESKQTLNAIRIAWAQPFARVYRVQYWQGEDAMDRPGDGEWKDFAGGVVNAGQGGTVTHRLTAPVPVRFLRIVMTESSNSCDSHGAHDIRNCVGYAISEIYLGNMDDKNEFHDRLRHSPDQRQSLTYCSSIDPWHAPSDLYVAPDRMESGDQPGLDLFFTSGITRGLPAMIPIALIYGTPEDSVAQIAYLKKRGYPISNIEMGEEADGQYMLPEDYAALYLQWATALHRLDPHLQLGGPAFQGVAEDIKAWADARGRTSWLGRFLDYLRQRNRLADFAFMSFEHYPYDGCDTPWANLYDEPQLLTHIMQVWRDDGLPPETPLFDTETNAHGGDASVDIFGALWLGDTFAAFLSAGGRATHYYHALSYSPPHPICKNSWGTYHMFMTDEHYVARQRTSQFFAAQLLTQEWAQPTLDEHRLYKATSDIRDMKGHMLVTAYAVRRPDEQWALLLINKDYDHAYRVRVDFGQNQPRHFADPVTLMTFGKAQYQWHAAGRQGQADPDHPPLTVTRDMHGIYVLPPASLNVLRGKLAPSNQPP
jgi:hypothetical protein